MGQFFGVGSTLYCVAQETLILAVSRYIKAIKVKERIAVNRYSHLTATGRHLPKLPYGITQCYLPPDTSERAPPIQYTTYTRGVQ